MSMDDLKNCAYNDIKVTNDIDSVFKNENDYVNFIIENKDMLIVVTEEKMQDMYIHTFTVKGKKFKLDAYEQFGVINEN